MGIKESLNRHPVIRVIGLILLVAFIGGMGVLLLEQQSGNQEHEFNSPWKALYWAIVTMTTVGYGDITPKGVFSQALAVIIMLTGIFLMAIFSYYQPYEE